MKTFATLTTIAAFLLPLQSSADYNFIPKLGIANKAYQLDMGPGFPSHDSTISASVTGLIWGFSIAHSSRWYMDFEQFDGTGTHEGFVEYSDDFRRSDISLSFGRTFDGGLSAFAGTRFGGSEFQFINSGGEVSNLNNDTTGFFVGGAKGFVIDPTSNVSLSLAIASLTAEFKSFHTEPDIDASGDTLGYSFGGAWNKRLLQNFNLSIGGRYQAYKYDDVKDDTTVIGDQSETISSVYAKLGYIF